ncbi:MAG: hypothetical protein NTV92_09005, partial [Candidatus Bipolaricaulota bacterium]|nr:hypothetical protein [Candidatus Bipolaricaulota bacterium]
LREKLDEKEAKIAELEDTARTLGYIKVEVPPTPVAEPVRHELVLSETITHAPAEAEFVPHMMGTAHRETGEARTATRERSSSEPGWGVIGVAPTAETGSEVPVPTLPPAVRRHVDRLVARVERRSLLERRVLAFLVTHSPGSYTASQIAAWTDCAREMNEDELPHELLEAGLIARERRTDGQRFQSRLKTYVSGEFAVYLPDIGEGGLHEVTQQLSERLTRIP